MNFTTNNINDTSLLSNATSDPRIIDCGINIDKAAMAISVLYFLIFIPALFLNGLALWVSCHMRSRSTFMVYLKNLMAADLIMAIIIPLKAVDHLPHSPASVKVICCRYISVIYYACMYMSIILLGLISVDRFFKIVRPWNRLMGQKMIFGKVVSASIWIIYLFSIVLPTVILTNQKSNDTGKEFCMRMKSKEGKTMHEVVIFTTTSIFYVVFIVVFFCYACIARKVYQSYRKSKSNSDVRHKTKARVFIVMVIILVCFGPYHAIRYTFTQMQLQGNGGDNCKKITFGIVKNITLWLSAINTCLDPFIYFFLCRPFREKLCELFYFEARSSSQISSNNTQQTTAASVKLNSKETCIT